MKFVITGVRGLLGYQMAKYLLKQGHEVLGIDSGEGGLYSNLVDIFGSQNDRKSAFKYSEIKICKENWAELYNTIEEFRPEFIYHFAGFAAARASNFKRLEAYEIIEATAVLLDICKELKESHKPVRRFIYTSSMSVYGFWNGMPYMEYYKTLPRDPYGIAKVACEREIITNYKINGQSYCILRPHNVYGPGQNYEDVYRNVLGIWMRRMRQGKPLHIFGSGTVRSFTYVEDILEPMYRAAVLPGAHNQIYNIGQGERASMMRLKEAFENVVIKDGHKPRFIIDNPSKDLELSEAWPYCIKSKNYLQDDKKTRLEVGIRKMWDWFKKEMYTYIRFDEGVNIFEEDEESNNCG